MRVLLVRTIDVFINWVRTHLSLHTDTINYFSSWPRSALVGSPWVVLWSSLQASELWTSPWSLRQSPTHQTWRGQDILHLPIFFVVQCLWIYPNLCWIPSVAKPLWCPFLTRRDPSGWQTCRQLVAFLTSLPIPLVCRPMAPRWRVPSIFPNNSTNLRWQQSTHNTSREGQGQTSSASVPQSSQELSFKGRHSSLRWCICSAWESLWWAVDNLSRSDWKPLSKL